MELNYAMLILLILITTVQSQILYGCHRNWTFPLNLLRESSQWTTSYISQENPNCHHFYGRFRFQDVPYRISIIADGPVEIFANKRRIFHRNIWHEQTIENLIIQLPTDTMIQVQGNIRLLDWEPWSLKIYMYNLPAEFNVELENTYPSCKTSMFASEPLLFHNLLHDSVRTTNPLKADYFYVPAHTSCIKWWNGHPRTIDNVKILPKVMPILKKKWPFWLRNSGKDHIFTHVHDFGACFSWKEREHERQRQDFGAENSIALVYGGDLNTKCYRPHRDIVIPPHTQHRRRSRSQTRDWIAFFQGTIHWRLWDGSFVDHFSNGIRQHLYKQYRNSTTIKIFDGSAKTTFDYENRFRRSIFGICPPGMATWTPRPIESIVHGTIPVIISDHIVLPFEELIDWSSISIHILEKDIMENKLEDILQSIPAERIQQMQYNIRHVAPKLLYKEEETTWKREHALLTLKQILRKMTLKPFEL